MIGYKNHALKRVGVSKLRLMAGKSRNCVVCETRLSATEIHKCAEHADWQMMVVDSQLAGAEARAALMERPDPSAPTS